MRRKTAALAMLAIMALLPLGAEATKPVLRVRPFSGPELAAGELAALQNLVTGYVVELKTFRVIDAGGQELALREAETAISLGSPKDIAPLSADYILSGSANRAGGLIVFTLEATKVATGEKRSVSETQGSVGELIGATRRLTRSLFERSEGAQAPGGTPAAVATGSAAQGGPGGAPSPLSPPREEAPTPAFAAKPTLAHIAGTWKGDKGLDRVNLFPDGRGLAVLSSGATMRLKALIRGDRVEIVQDQPNLPDFYRSSGIDFKTAKVIAEQARTWKWVFSLTEDRATLIGTKETVFVRIGTDGKVLVDNGYAREASWTRLFR